jgi:outer membrane protein assembly factor BamB
MAPMMALASDWPQWRGLSGDGISAEKNLPIRWSRTESIAWRVPLAGFGTSTPVIWGDHVFLTSQIGDGPFEGRSRDFENATIAKRTGEGQRVRFSVQAFDRRSGKLHWDHRFDAEGTLQPVHVKHNLASPSCVADGERVYAWFGTGQLVVLDFSGKLLWQKHLGKDLAPFDVLWGHGSSPALHRETLFLLCEHPPGAHLVAVDRRTGRELWRSERGKERRSYTTPIMIDADGKEQLIINTTDGVEGIDPANGKVLWHAGGEVKVPVPSPVFHGGLLYLNRGYSSSPFLAVRPGGKIEWEVKTGGPYVSSLLYYGGLLYMANERGIVSVADAGNGETLWRERLGSLFSASPVAADGHVYLLNEEGDTFVLKAGREKNLVAKNRLGERTLASPAISRGQIFIRSDDNLYCIGRN